MYHRSRQTLTGSGRDSPLYPNWTRVISDHSEKGHRLRGRTTLSDVPYGYRAYQSLPLSDSLKALIDLMYSDSSPPHSTLPNSTGIQNKRMILQLISLDTQLERGCDRNNDETNLDFSESWIGWLLSPCIREILIRDVLRLFLIRLAPTSRTHTIRWRRH